MVHPDDFGASRLSALTARERDVMQYVAMGKPNKIIAAELGISQRTIEAHRARIFQKMQVRNAVELARRVLLSESERLSGGASGPDVRPGSRPSV